MNSGEQLALKRFAALYGTPKPGPQGVTGPTGAAGTAGRATNTGATGSDGPIGPTGVTGPAGSATNTGATGPIGNTGTQGPRGFSSGQVLYLNGSATIGKYLVADTNPTKNTNPTTLVSYLTDEKILLASFATASLNITSIPPGIFNFVLTAKLTGINGVTAIVYAAIYKLSTLGVETLLLTSEFSSPLTTDTVTQVVFNCTSQNVIPLSTMDRIVIKFYSLMSNGDDTCELTLNYEDFSNNYARIHTPFTPVCPGPTGPSGQSITGVTLIPDDLTAVETTLNLIQGQTYIVKSTSALTSLTIAISTIQSNAVYSIKNYSANDINLLLSIDGNPAIAMNTGLSLPPAVLNKYQGVNPVAMSLFWDGTTMILI
jgi:hypothetical protein